MNVPYMIRITRTNKILQVIPGQEREYLSVDSVSADSDMDAAARDSIPLELLHSMTPSGMPRHKIVIKVGTVVMLVRNMDKARGLTNGTRLIVRHLSDNILQCDVLIRIIKHENIL